LIPVTPAQHILILLVRLYRCTLSPAKTFIFGPLGSCRFEPSCSQYALEAIRLHGAIRGSWLALKRIGRCNPYGGCGHDPVPPRTRSPQRCSCDSNGGTSATEFIPAHSK